MKSHPMIMGPAYTRLRLLSCIILGEEIGLVPCHFLRAVVEKNNLILQNFSDFIVASV